MNILFISNLYPNSREPTRAPYNKQKLKALGKYCVVTVVAPVPWFRTKIPFKETIDGFRVFHPRIFYIPKLFRFANGLFYFLSIRRLVKDLSAKSDFDIIYSSWLYPDGYAAMKLAAMIGKPFQVEALGSDVNLYLRSAIRKKMILEVLRKAFNIVVISKDLKEKICAEGIPEEKVFVIYIGVDRAIFYPMNKAETKKRLGLPENEKIILFIGNLVKIKGIIYLLRAFKSLAGPGLKLYIIGKGDMAYHLQRTIGRMGLSDKVVMAGVHTHERIPLWMNASELVCVPSIMEGQPNVILEAFACGIPVVASNVGGIPELITDTKLGLLTEPADHIALKTALEDALQRSWDRELIARAASAFTWEDNAAKRYGLLCKN